MAKNPFPNPGKQFMVTPHRPWQRRLSLLVVLGLLVFGGWKLFEMGRVQAGYDSESWHELESDLRNKIKELQDRNAELLNQNALLERSAHIETNAHNEVKKALADTQTEMIQLREQVSFYRGLVSPAEDREGGIEINALALQAGEQQRSYHFKLVLTQIKKNDKFAVGKVDFRIIGEEGSKNRAYTLKDLAEPAVDTLTFKFKYFQNLEGVLELPEAFKPKSIKVEVIPKGSRLKPVVKDFSWTAVFAGGE